MNPSRIHDLADAIEQWLRDNPTVPLPSIRQAADQWHIAYRTAWKAMQVLIERGLIASSPGKKIVRTAKGVPVKESGIADGIHARIRKRILDGTYQAGRPFPKIGYFCSTENASRSTLSLVFSRLSRDGLAHFAKKRWVIGPSSSAARHAYAPGSNAPVVLFLAQNPAAFSTYFEDAHAGRFVQPFLHELMGHGIHVTPALRSKDPAEVVTVPSGIDEVARKIRSLKDRYCGTVILCIFPEIEKLGEWIIMLSAFKKPVIWFDYADSGGTLTRSALGVGREYFRFYQDEQGAVRQGIEALMGCGHTIIGVHGADQFDWGRRRAERIRECAGALPHAPKIVFALEPAEPEWRFSQDSGIHEILNASIQDVNLTAADHIPAGWSAAPTAASLIEKTPSLAGLLREHAPTALIALNDRMALEYYHWFSAVGISIPKDFSILSFDNMLGSMFFPISTIDWGFERLGYLAAHTIIGDIAVHAGRDGAVGGPCTLIDRGSIARPGKMNGSALFGGRTL
jgi:DNA-binding transcriptional regulator YhcF (GntR family)